MKTARLFLAVLLLAFAGVPLFAQTNAAPPSDTAPAPGGSVVMPQPTSGPPAIPATPVNPAFALPPAGSVTSSSQDQIDDIRPPLFFLHSWLGLWIALGVLAVIALLVWLWKWFRDRAVMNPKTAYHLALEKLEQARELMREDDPAPYAVAVSETIRTYLGQRFQALSSRRTTEEFLRQMEADPGTPLAEHRELLGDFLRACDLVKFARYQPTIAELEDVQQRALSFVHATKPLGEENAPKRLSPAVATP